MIKKETKLAFDIEKLNKVRIIRRHNTLNNRLVYGDLDKNNKGEVLLSELEELDSNHSIIFDTNELLTVPIVCNHENIDRYYIGDKKLAYFEFASDSGEKVVDSLSVYFYDCPDCGYSYYFTPFVTEEGKLDYKEIVISENRLLFGNLTTEERKKVLEKERIHHCIKLSPNIKKRADRWFKRFI